MALKIPIGVDNFKEIIKKEYTYVDKTLLVEEVIEAPGKVQLIVRPRRFGKTLNMSMLAHFFDIRQDHKHLFDGLEIQKRPCFEQCGTRPVVFLSFKYLKAPNYESFMTRFQEVVSNLYQAHSDLLPHLSEAEKQYYDIVTMRRGDEGHLIGAITQLMTWLQRVHGKGVILLIDEYDSPIHEAYNLGYYSELINFMRSVLDVLLKSNDALEKAVLTGILRVARESIFSGMNHVKVNTILNKPFADKFGFTQAEVTGLLEQGECLDKAETVQTWYNGYQISGHTIYNPWSVLSFLDSSSREGHAHWVNTSGNDLVRELLLAVKTPVLPKVEAMLQGELLQTRVNDQLSLRDLQHNEINLWSLLLFSGYLTCRGEVRVGIHTEYKLGIPNIEVESFFQTIFSSWYDYQVGTSETAQMLDGLVDGNLDLFSKRLSQFVKATFSYYDTGGEEPERVYHMFVLGLLSQISHRYQIRSNRESGYGRYDIMMIPKDRGEPGVILEFKMADSLEALDEALAAGVEQIKEQNYRAELEAQGVETIREVAVAFCGKVVRVAG